MKGDGRSCVDVCFSDEGIWVWARAVLFRVAELRFDFPCGH